MIYGLPLGIKIGPVGVVVTAVGATDNCVTAFRQMLTAAGVITGDAGVALTFTEAELVHPVPVIVPVTV